MTSFRDERGQTTILMALVLGTFLFGFMALAVDVQYLFQQKRMAQAAADAAALAAAEELTVKNFGNEQAVADAMAKMNGFDTTLATNPATVTLSTPTAGNSDGSTSSYVAGSYIQARVSKPVKTFFMGVLNHKSTFTIAASAVAGGGLSSPTCVCLEGTTGMDLNMSNNAKLTASGCGITVDSSSSNAAQAVGSATITAISLGSVSSNWYPSGVHDGGSVSTTKVVQGISHSCAPALPPVPTYTGGASCTADPLTHYGNGGSSYSVGPLSTYSTTQGGNLVCYNSLTVGVNNDRVNLNAGMYVINGGVLHFLSGANNASNTGGTGVFFYLTNGASLVIDNGANVNLSAMTSGAYTNTLIYQDPADTATLSIQGGSNTNFTGTIYAPGAAITLGNGSGTTINADIVAQSLTMNGGGTLSSSATSNLGTLDLSTAKITE